MRERLWLDASRRAAGLYLVDRQATAAIEERDPEALPGRDRHALLLVRKHFDGRRLQALEVPEGRRALLLDFGGPSLVLRISGTPALSVVLEGAAVATLGEGAVAWPLPAPSPVSVPPPAAPVIVLPAPLEAARDRDLAPSGAVRFAATDKPVVGAGVLLVVRDGRVVAMQRTCGAGDTAAALLRPGRTDFLVAPGEAD